MNNEQIMGELQSSFDNDYGVSQQLIDNIARLIQENEKLKELTQKAFEDRQESIVKRYISKDKIKELLENETIDISGFRCIAVEDIEELMEVDNE